MSEPMSDLDRLVGSLRLYINAYEGEASQYADDGYPDEERECAALVSLLTEAAATITRLREALGSLMGSIHAPSPWGSAWGFNPRTLPDAYDRARQALGGEHG